MDYADLNMDESDMLCVEALQGGSADIELVLNWSREEKVGCTPLGIR